MNTPPPPLTLPEIMAVFALLWASAMLGIAYLCSLSHRRRTPLE